MRAKCRRLKAEHGLGLVVVDYLQLVPAAGRVENRQQEIASISRSLKGLAKELSVPVIALSPALARAGGPHGEAARSSRTFANRARIEQDADIVMFIYREEEYKPTDENRGIAEIIIGKQRNGPTGTLKLAFIKEFTRFENLEWRGERVSGAARSSVTDTAAVLDALRPARATVDLDRLAANYRARRGRASPCRSCRW